MAYNFSSLITVDACDTLIDDANRSKSALMGRKLSLENQIAKDLTTGGLANELAAAEQTLAQLNTTLENLPAGDIRNELVLKRHDAQKKVEVLTQRIAKVGPHELQLDMIDLGQVNKQMEGYDEAIAALEARKAEIQSGAQAA